MASTSSHHPQGDKKPTPRGGADPLVNQPDEVSLDFLSETAPATDNSPTIISKAGAIPAEAIQAETHPMGDLRGRRLAHFELLEPIGVGGMAAVLRARDT